MLLNPEIQKCLAEVGLSRTISTKPAKELSVSEKLEAVGFGVEDSFDMLRDIVITTENSSLRHKIIIDVLKMHGLMKETAAAMPVVNIIINDPSGNVINPILIPRLENNIIDVNLES